MRKYFIKIAAIALIAAILPMAGGFCFQGLYNPLKAQAVQAASGNMSDMNSIAGNAGMEACNQGQTKEAASGQINWQAGQANNQKGLLPCCVDGNHTDIATSVQSFELSKQVPVSASFVETAILENLKTNSYSVPNISPPRLLAVKTTNLRL